MTTEATAPPTCIAMVRREGMDRYCGQSVGLIRWTDHLGNERGACTAHVGGMKRRYPSEVPDRTAPAGTLGLPTAWARGKFAPDDIIHVENAIPSGYRINVIPQNPHRFVVVGLRDNGTERPDELFRTPPTADPVRVAMAMCERLNLEVTS